MMNCTKTLVIIFLGINLLLSQQLVHSLPLEQKNNGLYLIRIPIGYLETRQASPDSIVYSWEGKYSITADYGIHKTLESHPEQFYAVLRNGSSIYRKKARNNKWSYFTQIPSPCQNGHSLVLTITTNAPEQNGLLYAISNSIQWTSKLEFTKLLSIDGERKHVTLRNSTGPLLTARVGDIVSCDWGVITEIAKDYIIAQSFVFNTKDSSYSPKKFKLNTHNPDWRGQKPGNPTTERLQANGAQSDEQQKIKTIRSQK